MAIQETNFWLTTTMMPSGKSGPLPEKTDVAILGAGFTGLAAARELRKRGVDVTVLEANTIGWGASCRNGGMVLTGLKIGPAQIIKMFGLERAKRMHAASLCAIDLVEKIVEEERISCDFSRSGHLEVASKEGHFGDFQQTAELLERDFRHATRIIPKKELSSEIGSPIYYGGLVDELSAGVNPSKYVAGLATAVLHAGANVQEHTRATSIVPATREGCTGWEIRTTKGILWSRDVLVASSGYTGAATPKIQRKIIPIGSYIIVTEVLPETIANEVSPRNRMIYNTKHFTHYYRLTPDRRMLFGGRAAFFPENENTIRESAKILKRDMAEVFPQLSGVNVEYVWGGTLDFAFDMMPHAGRMDGLFYSVGYAGHGVAMATYLGTKMAEYLCTGNEDNAFAGIPFPAVMGGLYTGKPWFLPFAGMWFRFLDLVS